MLQYPVCQPGVTWFLSPPLSPSTFGVGMLSPSSTLTTVSAFLCMLCYIRHDDTLVTLRKSNAIFHLSYFLQLVVQVHVEIHLVPSMLSPKPNNIIKNVPIFTSLDGIITKCPHQFLPWCEDRNVIFFWAVHRECWTSKRLASSHEMFNLLFDRRWKAAISRSLRPAVRKAKRGHLPLKAQNCAIIRFFSLQLWRLRNEQ